MLIINVENFALNNKNEILDESGKLIFWTQSDFAYKQRVHVYDSLNSEIGYVQFKVLSIQNGNEIFDSKDKQIDISEFMQVNKDSNWNYDIECKGSIIANIKQGKIEILDNCDINKCILFIISLAE